MLHPQVPAESLEFSLVTELRLPQKVAALSSSAVSLVILEGGGWECVVVVLGSMPEGGAEVIPAPPHRHHCPIAPYPDWPGSRRRRAGGRMARAALSAFPPAVCGVGPDSTCGSSPPSPQTSIPGRGLRENSVLALC